MKQLSLALLTASLLLSAQGAAQVPSVHTEEISIKVLPQNTEPNAPRIVWREVIENHASSSIIALHATFICPKGSKMLIDYDPLLHYGNDPNILPGASIQINAADPSQCHGGVVAAIFSDGHTEGDQQEINAIYARRRGVYTALGESIKLLDAIAHQEKTPQQIREILAQRAQSIAYDETIDGSERGGMIVTYSGLRATLQTTQGIVHSPSDHTEHRQPFYSSLAESQNISLEQAQAIVISRKYQEWRSDLKGNMEPLTHASPKTPPDSQSDISPQAQANPCLR